MNIKKVKIFISFAEGAEEEYNLLKRIIEEETDNHFSNDGYKFIPICWKDIPPGLGHPQKYKIDPVIIDSDCKLVIIILKNRLGTKYKDDETGIEETGIEHEYNLAKSKKEVWIYDCDFILKQRRSEINPEQIKDVNDFIQKVKPEGLIRRVPSFDDLSKQFRSDFAGWARKLILYESNLSKHQDFPKYNRGF